MQLFRSIILFLLFPSILSAQETLTLETSVIEQSGKLAPANLKQPGWLPDGERLFYVSDEGDEPSLVITPATGKGEARILLSQINNAITKLDVKEIKKFPKVDWTGPETFLVDIGEKIISYNYKSDKAEIKLQYNNKAKHTDYHIQSNKLAYTIENNLFVKDGLKPVIEVTSHADKGLVAGQSIARNEFGITKGTFWSPGGDLLAFYEKDERKVSEYPLPNYSSVPASGSSFRYPMAGQASEEPKVGVYNFKEGKLIYLDVQGPKDQYLSNLAWSPDGKEIFLVVHNRDQNRMKLNKYDPFTGKLIKTLFEESSEKYVEPQNPPQFLETLPNHFIWQSDRDGFNHLYLYTLDGKLDKKLTAGEIVVKKCLDTDGKGKFLFFTATDSPLETALYKVSLSSLRMTKISDEGTHSCFVSPNREYILDSYSSLNIPRRINVLDINGKVFRTLLDAEDPLAKYKTGSVEVFTIKDKDQTDLYCRLIKPSDFDSTKKYPVLVYLYNGPHVQLITDSYKSGAPFWKFYAAEQGYLVFTIDGHGSANRGRDFEQAIFRQLGKREIQDQLLGVEYLKSLPYVDDEKLAVHGWSYGGFITASLMLRHPEVFNVGVAGGAVTDWNLYEVMYTERYMDTPETNPAGYKDADLKEHVSGLQGDLLLVHGLEDDVVVLQHNISLSQKLVKEGIQFDQFFYPGHKHNVLGKERAHLMRKVLDYIFENNQ